MLKTKLLAVLLLPVATGCSTAVHHMAQYYDSRDPCLTANKPQGHVRPAWCGTTASRITITTPQGQVIGYVRR
jgi:hypothetical protein